MNDGSTVSCTLNFSYYVQVVESLIKYTTKQVLDACQSDVDFIIKSSSEESKGVCFLVTRNLSRLVRFCITNSDWFLLVALYWSTVINVRIQLIMQRMVLYLFAVLIDSDST